MNPQQEPIEALRFIVDFAQQADLAALKQPQLGRLWRDVKVFAGQAESHKSIGIGLAGPKAFITRAKAAQDELVRSYLLEAWDGVRQLLTSALDEPKRFVPLTLKTTDRLTVSVVRGHGTMLKGPLRAAAMLRLQTLLAGAEGLRVQRCRAADCDLAFVKITRKEFCSTRCQSRFYMRQKRNEERQARSNGGSSGKKTRTR